VKRSVSASLDLMQRNPIRHDEMASIDLEDIPDGICVSCWAWYALRQIEDVPYTECRGMLKEI